MTIKCYNKPKRSKRRTFTAKDVGRITCEALKDGESPESVRDEVVKCLTLSEECQAAKDKVKLYEDAFAITLTVLSLVVPLIKLVKVAIQFIRLFRRIRENIDIVEKQMDDLFRRLKEIPLPERTTV